MKGWQKSEETNFVCNGGNTFQNAWAADLNSNLTYSIDPAYNVSWGGSAWRLPSAGANPQTGYNQTTSELGDLFYNDLGLTAYPPWFPYQGQSGYFFQGLQVWLLWAGGKK